MPEIVYVPMTHLFTSGVVVSIYWLLDHVNFTTSFCGMNNSHRNNVEFLARFFLSRRESIWCDLSQGDSSQRDSIESEF